MAKPTIRNVIQRVVELYPEALSIPDTEFRKLFDESAKSDFGVEQPTTKWKHWSVERERKRIKAERKAQAGRGKAKKQAKDAFVALCAQYRGSIETVEELPQFFQLGTQSAVKEAKRRQSGLEGANREFGKLAQEFRAIAEEADRNSHLEVLERAEAATRTIETQHMPDVQRQAKEAAKHVCALQDRAASMSAHVLPACFVYLLALLDSFIADALRFFYRQHPKQMLRRTRSGELTRHESSEQKRIRYQEVFDCDSLDALVESIAEREVRVVTAQGVASQLDGLSQCGVDFADLDADTVVEIVATRNVYVHNNGKVNADYLGASQGFWKTRGTCPFKLGETRPLDGLYLGEAVEVSLKVLDNVSNSVSRRGRTAKGT